MEPSAVEVTEVCRHTLLQGAGAGEGWIDGVIVRELTVFPDDRGHFAEIFRASDEVAKGFTFQQTSLTRTRTGVIKAFHYHLHQQDIFFPLRGTVQIALVDFRVDSPTRGYANSVFAGELYQKAVRIPAGVAHGYEVLPGDDLLMVYYTDREYDPTDEYRVPYDDRRVGFGKWGVRNR